MIPTRIHGTTILAICRDGHVVMAGDGQVTLGDTVVKHQAKKVRKMYHDQILAGFAGATADAFTLFERLEAKLEQYNGNLKRAAVELAKDWRMDRALRRLEAMLIAADRNDCLILSGTGDVIEPDDGMAGVGSGALLRPGGSTRLARPHPAFHPPDCRRSHEDCCFHLHLHQRRIYHRGALSPCSNRLLQRKSCASWTNTSSVKRKPNAWWPSPCATAGAASRSRIISAMRSPPRISS